ncbi:aromatic compound dioxygenase [Fomitiporia mediterranea MF3/22]|uniref:aromatic compound dioxygenase n=1 Tax=Fomitiporia mediterranea (strain MF3/22) TaxID=694068 RepID=UPI0004409788|nr:aromatic compound dioxygenase [Fomitiporia mediterranea MF3/22]EJC99938.1 aromatic compound dioxygenase [Fomitiporia mediterranea MF3/22]
MVNLASLSALVTILSATAAVAHPHSLSKAELARRNEFQIIARRSLAGCQSKLRARGGVAERAIARRKAFAEKARKARGLDTDRSFVGKRDLDTVLNTSHKSNTTGLTADSDPFDGNSSCVLGPEVTQGPYLVDGELIRSNITEDQSGIPLYADIELIDVETCEPVSGLYMDFWHANATGVYSGVVANGNGVGTNDATNINTTFLRGIQQTSDEGYAQFVTIFPGHYTSRATHIHVMVHQTDGTLNDNSTYTGGTVSHVGQVFFDQDLISQVEATSPYSTNTQDLTENTDDSILSEEADVIDPVMEYVLLGDDITDGILAWSSLGINTTASYDVSPAVYYTENGGVENPDSGAPGGGSAPSGSGAPPSASASASASA